MERRRHPDRRVTEDAPGARSESGPGAEGITRVTGPALNWATLEAMWSGDDIYFMRLALEEAERADRKDEVPIGAVVVSEGALLGRGHNCPISAHDPTAHAEVQALRAAGAWARNYRLTDATLYVTLEPCLMCFGALVHARVGRVVFGAPDPKVGVSRWAADLGGLALNHRVDFQGGLLEVECREQLQAFFRRRRG